MSVTAALHDSVAPLSFLLGRWAGEGRGSYPTIEPFEYGEEITVSHVASRSSPTPSAPGASTTAAPCTPRPATGAALRPPTSSSSSLIPPVWWK